MKHQIAGGVYPALVTPFDADGTVHIDVAKRLVSHQLERGAQGFYVCGSTGQGLYLTVDERKRVTEAVIEAVADTVPVLVHVGAIVVPDARELAAHAEHAGAAGISSVLPPTYDNLESVYAYFAALSDAAPSLPLFPYFRGDALPAAHVMARLMDLPRLGGTKYTGPNLYELSLIREAAPEGWVIFAGMDEQTAFSALRGADGSIGSSINLMPGAYREIWRLCDEGKHVEAIELQDRLSRIVTLLISYGYDGALREALDMLGFPCGTPRLPARPFEPSNRGELERKLEALGFADLAGM